MSPPSRELVAALLFVAGLVAGLAAAAFLFGPTDGAPPAALAFGAPHAWAGIRETDDTPPGKERVVRVRVPYDYAGDAPARFLLTLLVADDAEYRYPLGSRATEIAGKAPSDAGMAVLEARIRGGGALQWGVFPTLLAGDAKVPPPLEGTVTLREGP